MDSGVHIIQIWLSTTGISFVFVGVLRSRNVCFRSRNSTKMAVYWYYYYYSYYQKEGSSRLFGLLPAFTLILLEPMRRLGKDEPNGEHPIEMRSPPHPVIQRTPGDFRKGGSLQLLYTNTSLIRQNHEGSYIEEHKPK